MSTLLEIEEAIKLLPPDQVAELASWLDEVQQVNDTAKGHSEEYLEAQLNLARRRMEALDAGKTVEVSGEEARTIVQQSIRDQS
jgi:hypothetical protein